MIQYMRSVRARIAQEARVRGGGKISVGLQVHGLGQQRGPLQIAPAAVLHAAAHPEHGMAIK